MNCLKMLPVLSKFAKKLPKNILKNKTEKSVIQNLKKNYSFVAKSSPYQKK